MSDEVGYETLDLLARQDAFNRWMYETISPYCQGKILEIGSGLGNLSQFFIAKGADLTLSDCEVAYHQALRERFAGQHPLAVMLGKPDYREVYADLIGAFDTVYALNVVEHIDDDLMAMKAIYDFLRPGGKAIILVPAYMQLYNGFDEALRHFRRYNRPSLSRLLRRSGFELERCFYFNASGLLGWYVVGNLLGKRQIPDGPMDLYNRFVPVHRLIDRCLAGKMGLSVIAVGRRPV